MTKLVLAQGLWCYIWMDTPHPLVPQPVVCSLTLDAVANGPEWLFAENHFADNGAFRRGTLYVRGDGPLSPRPVGCHTRSEKAPEWFFPASLERCHPLGAPRCCVLLGDAQTRRPYRVDFLEVGHSGLVQLGAALLENGLMPTRRNPPALREAPAPAEWMREYRTENAPAPLAAQQKSRTF